MAAYLNSVIATVIVCRIAVMFSPDGEGTKKYVRLLASLVVLITLLSPIKAFFENADGIVGAVSDFFTGESAEDAEYGAYTGMQSEMGQLAYAIMKSVSDSFGVDGDNMRLTFVTNDADEICEVQLYLAYTAYSDREAIREALEDELGIPVFVFSER